MNREFSKEFVQDIGYLLEFCRDNKTDNVSLEMDVSGHTLIMDIQFKIKKEEWIWRDDMNKQEL